MANKTSRIRQWALGPLFKCLVPRAELHRILSNSSWLFADQALRIGLGALLSIWVARYFGPERLGAYSYSVALIALVAPIATYGLDSLVVRDLVRYPENASRILSSAVVLRIGTGCLSILGAIALAWSARPDDHETLILALIISSAAIFQAISVLDFWFQSKLQSKFSVVARDLAFLASAATKIWCVVTRASIEVLALSVLVEAVVSALAFVWIFKTTSGIRLQLGNAKWEIIRGYLVEARSLVLTGLLIALYMRVDRVIIGATIDNRAVGVYSVALQLCEIFFVIPNVIMSSLYPGFISLHTNNKASYEKMLINTMKVFFYVGLMAAIMLCISSRAIVLGMYGDKFKEAVDVFGLYVFILPLVGMSIVFSHWYILESKKRYSFFGVIAGGVFALATNYFAIDYYGIMGGAVVALLSQIVPSATVAIFFDRKVGWFFAKAIMPVWQK